MKKQSDIESTAVVIDNGCGTVKAGYAGETAPELVFPAVMSKVNDKIYFGEDALRCHQDHMTRIGAPRNWDLTEKTWQHVFEKLSTPFDCLGGVLVTENPNDTKPDREKTIEILFERFQVPASYLVLAATVALYATGRTTGLIADFGFNHFTAVPIYEGYAHSRLVQRQTPIGGNQITRFLQSMLVTPTQRTTNNFMNDISILTPTDDSINMYSLLHSKLGSNHNNYFDIEKLKESVCFVKSKDDEPKNEPYKLPDGRIISISSERYKCTEALFNPSFMNLDEKSVTDCIHECIINVDVETRKEMRQNVFAVGGTSSLPGLGTRLQSELLEKNVDFVVGAKTQKYEHWIGGSILASLSTFQSMWVSKCKSSLFCANPKVEYNESGSSVVHRKCF